MLFKALPIFALFLSHAQGFGVVCEDNYVDIGVLIDVSESITNQVYGLIKNGLYPFLSGFTVDPEQARLGLVVFNETSYVLQTLPESVHLDSFTRALDIGVEQVQGGTCVACGLKTLRDDVFSDLDTRSAARQIAVVLTDGVSSVKMKSAITEAKGLKNAGVEVYVFVLHGSKGTDERVLSEIATDSAHIYSSNDPTEFILSFRSALTDVCS